MTTRKCVINGCETDFNNTSDKNIKRHRIPWNNKDRCKQWIEAILKAGTSRSALSVGSRLCSLHFIDAKTKDAIPSIFPTPKPCKQVKSQGVRITLDKSTQKTPVKQHTVSSYIKQQPLTCERGVGNHYSCSDKGIQTTFTPINIDVIKHSDKLIKEYTGLDSHVLFQIVHKYLTPICDDEDCNNSCHQRINHPATKFRFISTENQFLLCLYKLKTNQKESVIAKEFSVSVGSVSAILSHWIGLMYRKFKLINTDIQLQQVKDFTPQNIISKFDSIKEIIDATEMVCAKPSDPTAQRQLWSNYKHNHTVKVQIGCTPTGAITSVSDTYGGMISDKKLFEKSDRVKTLKDGDSIMVDKGYLLADILQGTGVQLIRPPFLRDADDAQFTERERNEGRLIAKTRIVVENVNARIKNYKILSQKIPVTLLSKINEIVYICATLSNFGKPLR